MHKKAINILLILLLFSRILNAQFTPYQWPDTSELGEHLSRTMYLLHNSDPFNKTTVRILIYGQSINRQNWWYDLKSDLETRFPNANIDMRNLSIGGFVSLYLKKTTWFDILPFYPDLVIFHDYGGHVDKEEIIELLRSKTTTEVLWRSSHYYGTDLSNDHENLIPASCEEYGLEFGSFYNEWQDYLTENNLDEADLKSDNIHLNDHGKFLMSEMHKPYFYYHTKWPVDPDTLVTAYNFNTFTWNNDTLYLTFYGNRCDLVFDNAAMTDEIYKGIEIWADNKQPKTIQDIYTHTRPSHSPTDSACFANCIGTMIRLQNDEPLVEEKWTLSYTSINEYYTDFTFNLKGTLSGADGSGRKSQDFISNTGRVKIKSDDWFVKQSNQNWGTTIYPGYKLQWNTIAQGMDTVVPVKRTDNIENVVTLFQGLPNAKHNLKLYFPGDKNIFKEIRIYRPPLNRQYDYNKTVSFTLAAGDNGRISPAGQHTFNYGNNVEISALPDSSYKFSHWEGIDGTSKTVTVAATENMNMKAYFVFDSTFLEHYTLNTVASTGGTVSPSGSGNYYGNDTVEVTAVPNAGYVFSGWSHDTSGSTNPLQIIMNRDYFFIATFSKVTGIEEREVNAIENFSFSPKNNKIEIHINEQHLQNYRMIIYNVVGQPVLFQNINAHCSMADLSALKRGLYVVVIETTEENKKVYSKKIVL